MRRFAFLLAVVAACQSDAYYTEPPSPEPVPPGRVTLRAHPVGLVQFSGSPGRASVKTRGTAADRRETEDASYYRFEFAGRTGISIDWIDTERFDGGMRAEAFDGWIYGNLPLWPNPRLRFASRFGPYYDRVDLKQALPTDVEPWNWGFRYELEAEVDVIKGRRLIWTLFASGRAGYGWGDAKVGGSSESITATSWGYEAGTRLNLGHLMVGASWIDRTSDVDGRSRFADARYRFEGAAVSVGLRW